MQEYAGNIINTSGKSIINVRTYMGKNVDKRKTKSRNMQEKAGERHGHHENAGKGRKHAGTSKTNAGNQQDNV